MSIPTHLMPSIADWNGGAGVAPADWIWVVGRAEHALGYCALLWPDFEITGEYVLRAPFSSDRLRDWQKTGRSRRLIEIAMNLFLLDGVFPDAEEQGDLYEAQLKQLGKFMADMWEAKLRRDFPNRKFSVLIVDDGEDFGVTFHQI